MNRILVTGASGFVGRHVALALASAGHEVLAVSRGAAPAALAGRPGIHHLRADLAADAMPATGALQGAVHCAAAIPSAVPDEDDLLRINRESARRVFEHAVESGAGRIVFCSSMAAFGRIEDDLVGPDVPVRDPGAYGRSKIEGERMLTSLCAARRGLAALSIRLPGIVGPGSHDNFLSDTMARLLEGAPASARNPDAAFNNVVHVADLSAFLVTCLDGLPSGHRVVTLGADGAMPIRDVVAILEREAGRPGAVTYDQGGRPFLLDWTEAGRLGFRPTSVAESVARFAGEARIHRIGGPP